MKRFFPSLLNIVFPQSCVLCDAHGSLICPACELKLTRVGEHHCSICGIPFDGNAGQHPCSVCLDDPPHYDQHRAFFVFNDDVKKIIHGLKYHEQFWMRQFLGMQREFLVSGFKDIDVIVPIPLHLNRLKERGYNQSVLLAQTISRILDKPVLLNALERVKDTPSQTGLNKSERRKNLRAAFSVNYVSRITNKKILLVDDVHTTGVTLSMAAGVLKKAGAVQVDALSLAIVP